MALLNLYKPMGWTPLQTMESFKIQKKEFKEHVMVYAGRLDPMAEGALIVLTNEDRYTLKEHLSKEKTYEATFLFGYSSDTFDILGIVENNNADFSNNNVVNAVRGLEGNYSLPFPLFSAYKIKGKPLHWWARNGRVNEIDVPCKDMKVLKVSDVDVLERSSEDVFIEIECRVGLVSGDFRQNEIIKSWKSILKNVDEPLFMVKVTLDVSSGTYIRAFADMLGKKLGTGALLFDLKRTSVGGLSIKDSIAVN